MDCLLEWIGNGRGEWMSHEVVFVAAVMDTPLR
jgi:hypothetical protein